MGELRLLTDDPIGDAKQPRCDGLGFEAYARVLEDAILATPGPFTVGVFGQWGSGKTSLMRMLEGRLSKRDGATTVWFNAWQFEQEEHPLVALVATIVQQFEEQRRGKIDQAATGVINALRALAYAFSAKLKAKLPFFGEAEVAFSGKDAITRADEMITQTLQQSIYFRAFENLATATDALPQQDRIIVLIDDLDRCFPDNAIRLLETIKLVLSQRGFIFVLGVSQTLIGGYLRRRYEQSYGVADFQVEHYLDKIVQLPFTIPAHSERMSGLVTSLLTQVDPATHEALQGISDLIGPVCSDNPRAVIRFLNNLLVDRSIHEASLEHRELDERHAKSLIGAFAVTRALQTSRWQDTFSVLSESKELCETVAGWTKDEITEFAAREQKDVGLLERQLITLAQSLESDRELRMLLESPSGRDWLTREGLRKQATQFLFTRLEQVRAKDLSLIHTSWRDSKRDAEFGKKMYRFDAVIDATDELLSRIDSVIYHLHSSYPADRRKQVVVDRDSRFKLRELAWGETTLRADVKIRGQEEPIRLSCYIKLNETGPRI